MWWNGWIIITPLLSLVFASLLISTHKNCTDYSKEHYLQFTTKITANRAILTKLWPSEFWHCNGEFKHQISLGQNFFHTQFWTLFFVNICRLGDFLPSVEFLRAKTMRKAFVFASSWGNAMVMGWKVLPPLWFCGLCFFST